VIDVEMFKNVQNVCKSIGVRYGNSCDCTCKVVINLILILGFKKLFYQV
jgi:hypothetical protein